VGAALIYAFVFACLFVLDSRPTTVSLQRISVPTRNGLDPRYAESSREETSVRTGSAAAQRR
jgi:hypothetical protein